MRPIQRLEPDYQSSDSVSSKDKINILAPQRTLSFLHCSDPNYSVSDVWGLKDRNVSDYQLVSGYKSFFANQLVSYLKVNKPDLFTKYSEVQISEFLKKNMIV